MNNSDPVWIQAAPLPIIALDTEGKVRLWNAAATRVFGWDEEDVLARDNPIIAARDLAGFRSLFGNVLSGNAVASTEILCQRKDGSPISAELSAAAVYSANREVSGMMVVVTDITGRKLLEQQLQQAQKMEAVGRLAGGVAHDFNNMLTIILGHSQLLADQMPEQSPIRHHAQEIKKAGERAAGLTRQLLTFSRKRVIHPRVIDLNAAISDMEKMLRHVIGEDLEFVMSLNPELGRVKVDPVQIEQIVMNLVVNARDAMPQGGKLVIQTEDIEIRTEALQQTGAEPGPYVTLTVSDTGCGMDSETLSHIFEPFFTTKESEGTGLGLSTVYGIVKQSGGFIGVQSEPRHGTTFKIYFPRAPEPLSSVPRTVAGATGGGETILLVEDEPSVRELTKELLAGQGYNVLTAGNAEQALHVSRTHTSSIDLLLTDVVMPGFSGRELADQLIRIRPAMKVLFMSGYANDRIGRHGLLTEGMHFIEKPFTPDSLARKLREVLQVVPRRRLSILVVDDDESFRSYLCDAVEELGHAAFPASNGVDAWKLLRRLEVDLVITDLVMPYKDGIELVAEIRRDWPAVGVIAMSGVDDALRYASKSLSDIIVLQKPVSPKDVLTAIEELRSRE
ncbi:MAG: response regulator [Acidobacteria bacterium]|nr:response regulator [Acidobacteriota bacterium]